MCERVALAAVHGGAGEKHSVTSVLKAPRRKCCKHTAPCLTCPITLQPARVQARATMMELFSFYPGSCLWVASALNFTLSFSEKNRHTAKLTLCAGFWASFSRLLILVHDLPLKLTFLSLPRQNAQRSLYNMIKQMLVSIESSLGLGYLAPAPWLGVPLWWEEAAMFCTPKCNTQQTGRTTTLHLYLKPNKVTQNAVASEIW